MPESAIFGELVAEGAAEPVAGWNGSIVCHAQRFLIEARKPLGPR